MALIELDCVDSTFAADTTCNASEPSEQAAIDAAGRIKPFIVTICAALESDATFVVSSFFTVIIMVCLSFTQW